MAILSTNYSFITLYSKESYSHQPTTVLLSNILAYNNVDVLNEKKYEYQVNNLISKTTCEVKYIWLINLFQVDKFWTAIQFGSLYFLVALQNFAIQTSKLKRV